jgi:hypothetical protein
MTITTLTEKLKTELLSNKQALLITEWQSTASARHEFDPETYVFCEIITAEKNKRNIIRISGSRILEQTVPLFITIDVLHTIFRSPSHPNMYTQETTSKTVFKGYLTHDGKESEFSYPLLLGILNNVDGFFQ